MYAFTGPPLYAGEDSVSRLREEIAILERRLELMGMDGDCAYERAISTIYVDMVEEKKQQLATLLASQSR